MTLAQQPQYLSTCPACDGVLDVTAFEPFSKVLCPNCGQSVRVRRKFDHFIITRQIGEGGMSRVFESTDSVLGRSVALKILNRRYSRDGVRMKQFEREAQLTAAVTHPNVVKLYSVGRDQGNFYIAMEMVGGGSLEQRIQENGRLEEHEALRVGRAVAEGLRAAYREGLIHRDVKPANILFTEDGTPKIVDFGLALFHERDVDDSGEIWATPFYVAPEKVSDDREDFRSDMFSLGATLFHALTGKPPHQANTNSLAELKVIKSEPVKLEDSGMRFSPRTCELVDRLLSLDPDARFKTYDALVEAFRDAESLLGYSRMGERGRRQKVIFGAIGAGALAIVAIAFWPRGGDGPRPPVIKVKSSVAASELSDLGKTLASGGKTVAVAFREARDILVSGRFAEARKMFEEIAGSDMTRQPTKNSARFNAAICAIIAGAHDDAVKYFRQMDRDAQVDAEAGDDERTVELRQFFSHVGQRMKKDLGLSVKPAAVRYGTTNEEALGYLAHGLAQWHFGDPVMAARWLTTFSACEPKKDFEWVTSYKRIAVPYLADAKLLEAFGPVKDEPCTSVAAAREDSEKTGKVIKSLQTAGVAKDRLAAHLKFVESEIARFRRTEHDQILVKQKETRQRELSQYPEIIASLPAMVRGYDFTRVIELLKGTHFESPELQTAIANKLYIWNGAQAFVDQVMADVNARGYTGSVARRSGTTLQGRVGKMDGTSTTVSLSRGDLVMPTESVSPDTLVAMAQKFCSDVHDSADYYRRQELIAVFAKLEGLDQMAHTVAAQLMEENRGFRQRWTSVEQGGS